MTAAFSQILRPLAAVALPACILLAVAAEDVIRFVYGSEWLPAATALRWLAVMAAFRIFFELTYDYLVVLGRSRSILAIQCVWFAALLPGVLAGVHLRGIAGAGAALVVVSAVVVLPLYLHALRRVGIVSRSILRQVFVPALATLVLGAMVVAVTGLVSGAFVAVSASALLSAAVTSALLWRYRTDLKALRGDREAATV